MIYEYMKVIHKNGIYDIEENKEIEVDNLNTTEIQQIYPREREFMIFAQDKIDIYDGKSKKPIKTINILCNDDFITRCVKNELIDYNNVTSIGNDGSIILPTTIPRNYILLQKDKHIYYTYFILKNSFEDNGIELHKDIFNIIIKYMNFDHFLIIKSKIVNH